MLQYLHHLRNREFPKADVLNSDLLERSTEFGCSWVRHNRENIFLVLIFAASGRIPWSPQRLEFTTVATGRTHNSLHWCLALFQFLNPTAVAVLPLQHQEELPENFISCLSSAIATGCWAYKTLSYSLIHWQKDELKKPLNFLPFISHSWPNIFNSLYI